jgi:hypothetical protein
VKWWFGDESLLPQGRFDLAFTLRANTFRGQREVMIQWLDARPAAGETLFIGGPSYEVIDYRQHPDPRGALGRFLAENPGGLVWREGENDLAGVDRYHLTQTDTLIVWTSPAGSDEWQAALDMTKARRLVLFGAGPEPMPLGEFLKRVAGMVKYALNQKNGDFTLQALAAATAQRESTLRAAMEMLAAQGSFDLSGLDWLQLPVEAEARARLLSSAKARLQALYQETASYRRYWREQRF